MPQGCLLSILAFGKIMFQDYIKCSPGYISHGKLALDFSQSIRKHEVLIYHPPSFRALLSWPVRKDMHAKLRLLL